jgi:hypothetical protein
VGRARKEKEDVARAKEDLQAAVEAHVELEQEFQGAVNAARADVDPTGLDVEEIVVRPRKSDLSVERVALAWAPWIVGPEGIAEPGFGG